MTTVIVVLFRKTPHTEKRDGNHSKSMSSTEIQLAQPPVIQVGEGTTSLKVGRVKKKFKIYSTHFPDHTVSFFPEPLPSGPLSDVKIENKAQIGLYRPSV